MTIPCASLKLHSVDHRPPSLKALQEGFSFSGPHTLALPFHPSFDRRLAFKQGPAWQDANLVYALAVVPLAENQNKLLSEVCL